MLYRLNRQSLWVNGPFYLGAAALIAAAWFKPALWPLAGLAAWWLVASIVASYWVYARSELASARWMQELLPGGPTRWCNLHAGLDPTSDALRALFPTARGVSIDLLDSGLMTEASIRRAAQDALPLGDQSIDTVVLMLAARELRDADRRAALFAEIERVLETWGSLLIVEHVRDLANFLAFGPGLLHFFPERVWREAATAEGLEFSDERRITPFVRALHFRKPRAWRLSPTGASRSSRGSVLA